MTDYSYPADLTAKASARIQAQLKGNRDDLDKAELVITKQGLGIIKGKTGYDINCTTEQQTETGKSTKGKVVEGGQLQQEVEAHLKALSKEKTYETAALENIKKLPSEGFGADKQTFPLSQGKTVFVEHRTCQTCRGEKQMTCAVCSGNGRSQCHKCAGIGEMNCLLCHGQGQIKVGDQAQQCHECQGRGRVYCNLCHGQKFITCATCQGQGRILCKSCDGKGASSKIITVIPQITTHAEIHIHDLDPEPKRMASLVTPEKLVAGGHIKCKTVKAPEKPEKERAYYEDAPEPEKKSVHYEAELPWAVGEITIDQKPFKLYFAGDKGAVCEADNFMDQALQKPLSLLESAANNSMNTSSDLEEASKYRFSRETLTAVINGRKKKAALSLHKQYSLGLSKPAIMSAVKNGYLALKKVTRKPRYIGLGIGLCIAVALYAGWFIGGFRSMSEGQDQMIRFGIDGVLFILGGLLTMATIKISGLMALKTVFDKIGVPVTAKTMPAVGKAGLYGWGGCLLVWGGLLLTQIIM